MSSEQILFHRIAVLAIGNGENGAIMDSNKGIRIAFTVDKTIQSEANTATIQIYNLASQTRSRFRKTDAVRLSAGYLEAASFDDLYIGEVTRVVPGQRSGADIITTVECGDGVETFKSQDINLQFPKGTAVADVVLKVAREFTKEVPVVTQDVVLFGEKHTKPAKKESKVSTSNLQRSDLDKLTASMKAQGFGTYLRRPMSVAGNAREVMDKLARMWRFDWSVQDGAFQVVPYGETIDGEAFLISPSTGLLGTPEETDFGVKFTCLLIPGIRPGGMVRVSAAAVTGQYRIEKVHLSGDTRGDDWSAEVEARAA